MADNKDVNIVTTVIGTDGRTGFSSPGQGRKHERSASEDGNRSRRVRPRIAINREESSITTTITSMLDLLLRTLNHVDVESDFFHDTTQHLLELCDVRDGEEDSVLNNIIDQMRALGATAHKIEATKPLLRAGLTDKTLLDRAKKLGQRIDNLEQLHKVIYCVVDGATTNNAILSPSIRVQIDNIFVHLGSERLSSDADQKSADPFVSSAAPLTPPAAADAFPIRLPTASRISEGEKESTVADQNSADAAISVDRPQDIALAEGSGNKFDPDSEHRASTFEQVQQLLREEKARTLKDISTTTDTTKGSLSRANPKSEDDSSKASSNLGQDYPNNLRDTLPEPKAAADSSGSTIREKPYTPIVDLLWEPTSIIKSYSQDVVIHFIVGRIEKRLKNKEAWITECYDKAGVAHTISLDHTDTNSLKARLNRQFATSLSLNETHHAIRSRLEETLQPFVWANKARFPEIPDTAFEGWPRRAVQNSKEKSEVLNSEGVDSSSFSAGENQVLKTEPDEQQIHGSYETPTERPIARYSSTSLARHTTWPTSSAGYHSSKPWITCYYWAHGSCHKSERDCTYRHENTGNIANAPSIRNRRLSSVTFKH